MTSKQHWKQLPSALFIVLFNPSLRVKNQVKSRFSILAFNLHFNPYFQFSALTTTAKYPGKVGNTEVGAKKPAHSGWRRTKPHLKTQELCVDQIPL